MRRYIQIVVLCLLTAMITEACGDRKTVAVTESEAEIKFDTLSHDFGLVPQDTSVCFDFIFHNIGATPLHLTEVASSCGCTLVNYPRGSVDPGERASISVTYDSHDVQSGHFLKTIRIRSNAKTSFLRLSIRGEVVDE